LNYQNGLRILNNSLSIDSTIIFKKKYNYEKK
jgi:hypothetical protein